MAEKSIVIVGLPASGKTTFLAALWHLVTAREVPTALRFERLGNGDVGHLRTIASRWRDARVQDRTTIGRNVLVSMNLIDSVGTSVRVTFPDVAGEAYKRMWETRSCEPGLAQHLGADAVLLFIHSDTIESPTWVVDEMTLSRTLGVSVDDSRAIPWSPSHAPTQVQLVDLLQLLHQPPLSVGPRRLAIMLSAWDKARDERRNPVAYLEERLPLLFQYLHCHAAVWTLRVYGLSAQGGEYDVLGSDADANPEANELRTLDRPSERILLLDGDVSGHDLTAPLAWLIGSSDTDTKRE